MLFKLDLHNIIGNWIENSPQIIKNYEKLNLSCGQSVRVQYFVHANELLGVVV